MSPACADKINSPSSVLPGHFHHVNISPFKALIALMLLIIFIQFSKYLLSSYCVPDSGLDAGDRAVSETKPFTSQA